MTIEHPVGQPDPVAITVTEARRQVIRAARNVPRLHLGELDHPFGGWSINETKLALAARDLVAADTAPGTDTGVVARVAYVESLRSAYLMPHDDPRLRAHNTRHDVLCAVVSLTNRASIRQDDLYNLDQHAARYAAALEAARGHITLPAGWAAP